MLQQVAEKALPQAIKPGVLAYCPTMDLVALATVDEQVHVYRLNGQRVFGVVNKNAECKILKLTWKPNGRILAVAQSTGIILLINSHTGKIFYQLDCRSNSQSPICALGWGLNFIEADSFRARLNELSKEYTLDDVLNRGMKDLDIEAPLDLPSDLAFLDVESVLPKLSTLPTAGKDDDVFASRASIDSMFHSSKKDSNDSVDSLLIGFEDGTVYLSIYDFFEIGSFSGASGGEKLKVLQHCSHPYSSTHGLLIANGNGEHRDQLSFIPVDLRLITETGRYLSLLASKATQLQNLIRYIQDIQSQIYTEFASSQDLPKKFIRNIEETLQEKENTSFMNGAFHLVATGDCSPSMKEWLVDELGERGHKRWDKAATSGYENVVRFTFQNLLPAFDRFGVLISRLRGLSRFQETTSGYGLDTIELDHVLDTLSCLMLHGHTILTKAGSDLREYTAFSRWMKLEIDMQMAEAGSQTADDLASKYSGLDYPAIFEYIQGPMLNSSLYELFSMQPSDDQRPPWQMPQDTDSMYDAYKKALRSSKELILERKLTEQKLPGLSTLIARLDRQCKLVFKRIAETQKRKVRFGLPIPLGSGEISCSDIKAVIENDTNDHDICTFFVAATTKGKAILKLYRITVRVTNGVSSTENVDTATIEFSNDSQTKDVKFADANTLVLARKTESASEIIYLPYNGAEAAQLGLEWQSSAENRLDLTQDAKVEALVRHRFTDGQASSPDSIAVNGMKGRRALCVVAEVGNQFRVFDLDSSLDEEDEMVDDEA